MSYWAAVLKEVLSRDQKDYQCMLTTPLDSGSKRASTVRGPARRGLRSAAKVFFLGKDYPGVYFTTREAQCMVLVMQGYTLKEIGQRLILSPRTIECYVRNMRSKLGCRSRANLIRAILESDFPVEKVHLPELN